MAMPLRPRKPWYEKVVLAGRVATLCDWTRFRVLRQVRRFCVECAGGSYRAVRECTNEVCPLWPIRFGLHPRTARKPGLRVVPERAQTDYQGEVGFGAGDLGTRRSKAEPASPAEIEHRRSPGGGQVKRQGRW
jgi:hypothetical protein